ncbi:MAG: GNAT family N-acetyltransferase [Aeromicrobium sp.]
MTLRIRRINLGEFNEVGDLIVDSYGHNGYLVLPDGSYDGDYAAELRAAEQRNVEAEVWLAVDGDDILGCVTWCPVGSPYRELSVKDTQAEFRGLAVAPHARGRVAGRALVQHCLDLARKGGHDEVVLCSLPEMKTAHRLYESLGFGRRPELDWSPIEGVTLWAFGLADLS